VVRMLKFERTGHRDLISRQGISLPGGRDCLYARYPGLKVSPYPNPDVRCLCSGAQNVSQVRSTAMSSVDRGLVADEGGILLVLKLRSWPCRGLTLPGLGKMGIITIEPSGVERTIRRVLYVALKILPHGWHIYAQGRTSKPHGHMKAEHTLPETLPAAAARSASRSAATCACGHHPPTRSVTAGVCASACNGQGPPGASP
jgi:hypothetical protein